MLDFADPQQKSRYNIKLVSRYSTCYCKLVWPEYYLASSARQVVRAMLVREVEINLNLSNCCLFRYMMVYMYRGPTDNHVRQANKIQFDLFFILLWWLLITVNRGTRWQHHQSSYQVAKPTVLQRKSINKQHQNVTAGRVWQNLLNVEGCCCATTKKSFHFDPAPVVLGCICLWLGVAPSTIWQRQLDCFEEVD